MSEEIKVEKKTRRINKSKSNLSELPAIRVGRLREASQLDIEQLSEDLIAWARLESSLVLSDFPQERHIAVGDFYALCNKHEGLKMAKENAMYYIGSRREKGALTNKFNASLVMHTLPRYDKEYKELVEWRAKLAKEDKQEDNGPKFIVIDRYQDAPKSEEPK